MLPEIPIPSGHPLPGMLEVSVRLRMAEMESEGGPTSDDFKEATAFGQELSEHGDDLLFQSKKQGRSAELFNKLAHAVTVLSFCPGGIKIFGTHYEGKR